MSTSDWIQNIPLSTDIATQEELDQKTEIVYGLSNEVVDGLSNVVNPKLSTIADLISAEVEKINELSGKISEFVPLSDYQILSEKVTTIESRLSDIEEIIDTINGTN